MAAAAKAIGESGGEYSIRSGAHARAQETRIVRDGNYTDLHRTWTLTQESLGELSESVIPVRFRSRQYALHMRPELRLAPVITGRHLGASRLAIARGLEQRFSCGRIKTGIFSRRKVEATRRVAPLLRIIVDESA